MLRTLACLSFFLLALSAVCAGVSIEQLAPQPLAGVFEVAVCNSYAFANPKNADDPYFVFAASGILSVIRSRAISAATTAGDFVSIIDKFGQHTSTAPIGVFSYQQNTKVCWIGAASAGCADVASGNVSWNVALGTVDTTPQPYATVGTAGPNALWYRQMLGSQAASNIMLLDLITGSTAVASAVAYYDITTTTCLSSKLCVGMSNNTAANFAIGFDPSNHSSAAVPLWTVTLPTANVRAENLVVATDANGRTVLVGADSYLVFGIDVASGTSKFNVGYDGFPFRQMGPNPAGSPFVGVCGGVIVVLGLDSLHILSIDSGATVTEFYYTSNAQPWCDFLCYRDTHFYVGVGGWNPLAFFGSIQRNASSIVPTVTLTIRTVFRTHYESQNTWSNDGYRTAFSLGVRVLAFDIVTGEPLWRTPYKNSFASITTPYPTIAHAPGTALYCFMSSPPNSVVECVDASVQANAFRRNFNFVFGATSATVVTAPIEGDGTCILDASSLRLIADTAVAAGDGHANSASNSNASDSGSVDSPVFKTDASTVPFVTATADGLEVAVVVATLKSDAGGTATQRDCIRSFDVSTGALLWARCLATTLAATPFASHTTVFAVDSNGTMLALDLQSGKQLWSAPLPASGVYGGGAVAAVMDDRRVFMTTATGNLLALDVSNGTILWVQPPPRDSVQVLPPSIVSGITVYACALSSLGPLKCRRFDAETGVQIGCAALIANPSSPPQFVLHNRRLLVSTMQNESMQASVAGLYEVNWENTTLSRYVVEINASAANAELLGVVDGFAAFRIRTVDVITSSSIDSIEVHRLSFEANQSLVWAWPSNGTALQGELLSGSIIGSPSAQMIVAGQKGFGNLILVFDWYTGTVLRVIPRTSSDLSPPHLSLLTTANGTLLWLRATSLEGAFELASYPQLRPSQQYTSPAPAQPTEPAPPTTSAPSTTDTPSTLPPPSTFPQPSFPPPSIEPSPSTEPELSTTVAPELSTTVAPELSTTVAPELSTTVAPELSTTAAPPNPSAKGS